MSAGSQPIGSRFGPFVLDNLMVYLGAFVSFHKGNDACSIPYVMFEWEIIARHTKDYLHLISITFYWVSFTVLFLNCLMICLLYLVTFWRYSSTWVFLKVISKSPSQEKTFSVTGDHGLSFSYVSESLCWMAYCILTISHTNLRWFVMVWIWHFL